VPLIGMMLAAVLAIAAAPQGYAQSSSSGAKVDIDDLTAVMKSMSFARGPARANIFKKKSHFIVLERSSSVMLLSQVEETLKKSGLSKSKLLLIVTELRVLSGLSKGEKGVVSSKSLERVLSRHGYSRVTEPRVQFSRGATKVWVVLSRNYSVTAKYLSYALNTDGVSASERKQIIDLVEIIYAHIDTRGSNPWLIEESTYADLETVLSGYFGFKSEAVLDVRRGKVLRFKTASTTLVFPLHSGSTRLLRGELNDALAGAMREGVPRPFGSLKRKTITRLINTVTLQRLGIDLQPAKRWGDLT